MRNFSNRMSDAERFNILQLCSGNFLCDTLPDEWEDMSEEDQDSFIVENAWQPFEGWPANEVFEIINNAAFTMVSYIESNHLNKE